MKFNAPKQITQGDRVTWIENFTPFDSATATASLFIRGDNALDLTGSPLGTGWIFEITGSESASLRAGVYLGQFVIFYGGNRSTLGVITIDVLPSFETLSHLDIRTTEEKELAALNEAIFKLSSGVAEYSIGDRRVRYSELPQLYERQKYLQNRIARMKNRGNIGGRNVGIRFSGNDSY